MKIYLIHASGLNDPLSKKEPFMPLAFPILASCAPAHDYVVKDLMHEDISTIDYKTEFDIIGISFRVSATDMAFEIADNFRDLGRTVVMGGPQASSIPIKTKKHADAVVIGEGEQLWPILLKDYENNELKEFYLASSQKNKLLKGYTVFHLSKPTDLKDIAFPQRNLIKKKYTFDVVYAARGCPVNCSFCAVPALFGTKMRFRKIEDVVKEVSTFGKKYSLLDDNIFGRQDSYAYYKELYTALLKTKKKRYWTGQANLNATAHEEGQQVIALAAMSGLAYAAIGFETLNKRDMQKLSVVPKMGVSPKGNHLQEISRHIRFIQEQGVAISAWFTIGLENDTVKSINEVINYCIHHHIFPVLTPIQALEGTPFHKEMQKKGLLKDFKTNVSNVALSALNNQDYIDLMGESLKKAFTTKKIVKNTMFYLRKNMALKKSFSEVINRTIFIYITQKKLKKIIQQEIIRFKERIHDENL